MKPLAVLAPVVIFAAIAAFLFFNLERASRVTANRDLVDRPLPDVALEAIAGEGRPFEVRDVHAGKVSLVNIWASWCAPCRLEAPQLKVLAARGDVALYGVAFKDTPERAGAFLDEAGRPYMRVAADPAGRIAKSWDVHSAPQTFVVDGRGIVRARFQGPITPSALHDKVLPEIARVEAE